MHHYLPSIGFKTINSRKKLSNLLQEVETSYTHHELVTVEEEIDLCEFSKEYGYALYDLAKEEGKEERVQDGSQS